jgi:hypothetical protein
VRLLDIKAYIAQYSPNAARLLAARLLRRSRRLAVPSPNFDNLEVIRSAAIVAAHALMEQNCELDDDVARVFTRHVGDALTEQMRRIGLMIQGAAS